VRPINHLKAACQPDLSDRRGSRLHGFRRGLDFNVLPSFGFGGIDATPGAG
jgi:hypothetical protein